ncbi:MAG: hypothetical protein IT177_22515 [Acidobacteria bacterium]|nr:hypothetical protein [Acidobacteriota bacterium]
MAANITREVEPESAPLCPYCDSTLPAEPIGAGRYWCACCARVFEAPHA